MTVYPVTLSPWFTQVYAGLFDLARSGRICISISNAFDHATLIDGTSLPLRIRSLKTEREFALLIDLNDNRNFAHPSLLSEFDVIAKRSYLQRYLERLSDAERHKIIPYGINLCAGSTSMPIARIFFAHHAIRLSQRSRLTLKLSSINFQHQARFLLYLLKSNLSLFEDDFTEDREIEPSDTVFFVTRLFGTDDKLTPFSLERVELVRRLKEHFADRFFGGIIDNKLSRKHCSRELLLKKLSRREFIRAQKNAQIVVSTLGVGDSTPWKLGEALAGGRCIVSEPLRFALPVELVDDQDFKTFSSIDECLQVCEALMADRERSTRLSRAAASFYDSHVRSARLLENLLRASEQRYSELSVGD